MKTVGKLRSIIASVRNGIELGDTVETLEWCADTIERLQSELETAEAVENTLNGELKARDDTIELLTKERDEARNEAHRWSQEALNQVGASRTEKSEVLAKLEMARVDLNQADAERDAALAEVEQQRKQIGGLEYHLEAARAEVGRVKGELREGFDAEGSGIELRRRMDAMGR